MEDLTKKYYKIKDTAEIIGVPPSTIRYWEKEFPQFAPTRSAHNQRYYTPQDIETLRKIHFLLKVKGLKLEAAKEQLQANPGNLSRHMAVVEKLKEMRGELEMLGKALSKRSQDERFNP